MPIDERSLSQLPDRMDWYFRQSDGVDFVDPLYGGNLVEPAWPPVLDHDSISRTGREYLQAADHPICVVHAYHAGSEDFGDIVREHGDSLEAAAVIAIEADWDPAYTDDLSNPAAVSLPEPGPRRDFLQTQIEWAQSKGKYVLPYDIDGPEDPLRKSLIRLFTADIDAGDIPFPDVIPAERRAALGKELCMGAYMTMRHAMLLGQLGLGLSQLADQGKIAPRDQVVATLGYGHYPSFYEKLSRMVGPERATVFRVQQRTLGFTKGVEAARISLACMTSKAGMTTAEMLTNRWRELY